MNLFLISVFVSLPAKAFCGTFVGGVGSEFFNSYSQAAIVRTGQMTTLTVQNDVIGSFTDFALVMPVPQVLSESDIRVIDPVVFDNIDTYSMPRLVNYTCDDFEMHSDTGWLADSASDAPPSEPTVSVEAQYIVGEYEVVILSASESQSLFDWLNSNGYQVPGQSITLLQEYISAGQYFLAAKVAPSAGIQSGDLLSPLQLAYESSAFALPIRIGTLNAKDSQDLVLYVLNDYVHGAAGIANYPEFTVEDECMWNNQGEAFGQYYADLFTEGYDSQNEGSYLTEYAWGGGGCDPCTGDPPSGDDLISLGVSEDRIHSADYFFTRLHMRYTPNEAGEDLVLYHTNILEQSQIRFIEYLYELEDRFPVCGMGMIEDPGTCDDSTGSGDDLGAPDVNLDQSSNSTNPELSDSGCGSGCSNGGAFSAVTWTLAFGLGISRRRKCDISTN
ncbi:MAG: DUF2330 domain-containing protein [Myxococcota bacterium]